MSVLQDITELGGGELILSPSTGSAVAHPINIRSTSVPAPYSSTRCCITVLSRRQYMPKLAECPAHLLRVLYTCLESG